MKFTKWFTSALIFFILIWSYTPSISQNQTLAFPGADGFAKFISGGRGGQVRKVTNLNDSGPGSFREAASYKVPTTIIFEVSGTIELKSNVTVQNNTTVAGQSAPGDGITFKNYRLTLINKNNIVIRFIRFRLGDLTGREDNPIFVRDCTDIIFDHCTMSWGTDETGTNFRNKNVTFQWCLFSEGLHNSVHSKGPHGYGAVFGGKNISFHHNLFAHFSQRTPMFDHPDLYKTKEHFDNFRGTVDFRNNVVYNWMDRAANGGVEGNINLINNYFKPGPATNKYHMNFFLNPTKMGIYNYGKFYINGNFLEGNPKVSSDNWYGVRLENPELTTKYLVSVKTQIPFPAEVYEKTNTAIEAYQKVLQYVGASLFRDPVDSRIIEETKNGSFTHIGSKGSKNGIIDSQNDVGGWPLLNSSPPPNDSDNDGMPDSWEIENGLNPNKRDDRWYHLDRNYTNIEIYLNSLVNRLIDSQ